MIFNLNKIYQMNKLNRFRIHPGKKLSTSPTQLDKQSNESIQTQLQNVIVKMVKTIIKKSVTKHCDLNFELSQRMDNRKQAADFDIIQQVEQIHIFRNKCQKHKDDQQFNHRLDPRDQILEHSFDIKCKIDYNKLEEEKKLKIEKSIAFKPLCQQINQYLVRLVENVTSVSFNYLMEGKLTENETKDFASKNILMNVSTLFKGVLTNSKLLRIIQKYGENDFKSQLCEFIDQNLRAILQNIISYYPQSTSAGASPKMKKQILSIDRNDNQELDFLKIHKLKIERQKDGDYTQYIMTVINKMVQVPDKQDDSQQTLYQKFVNFSESLFWMSKQSKQLENIFKNKDQYKIKAKKNKQIKKQQNKNQQNSLQYNILQYLKKGIEQKQVSNQYQLFQEQIEKRRDKQIDQMKKNHNFSINKKLPNGIELFSSKNIKNKEFNVMNSSMLRILTKWAQNLMQIFENPQIYTIDRIYPFKNIKHQIFHATQYDKQTLCNQIKQKKKEMQLFRDNLIFNNTIFQSIFLNTDHQQFTKLLKRYTETRMLASNINNLLIHLMKQLVSKLIHLLIQAGTIDYGDTKIQIDLVVLRLGDLMRSKVYCTESSFIFLLKTLYILDQQLIKNQEKQLLKLVRIKNKLNTKDNNILINYVFMGQIQCELQMSVQRMQHKQQNFNDFNHFLYQIIRGKFGVLSECATIIAQHDPIISNDGGNHSVYQPKKKKDSQKKQIQNQKKQLFICSKCNELKQPKSQFLRKLQNKQKSQQCKCDQCRIKLTKDKQSLLKDQKLKTVITKLIQGNTIESVQGKTYNNLKQFVISNNSNSTLLVSVMPGSLELNYELVGYMNCQAMLYASTVQPQMFIKNKPIQHLKNKLMFTNLTSFIQKQKKLPYFTYITKKINNIEQVMTKSKFKDVKDIQSQISKYKLLIQNQIMEEMAASRVKNKVENLVFKNKQQLKIFGDMIQGQINSNLGSIEFVFSQQLNISKLPKWIGQCSKLKILDVRSNQIADISVLKKCTQINQLYLSNNAIQQIKFDEFQSSWKNLNVLMLGGNFEYLQLGQLPKLTILQIGFCERLKLMQLNEYPQLQTLKIYWNNSLTSLQLNEYPQLQTLQIYNNSLISFQLKANPQLKTLKINWNNSLTSLKLKEYPQLQTLQIFNNLLISLQLKEYPQLQSLSIYQQYSLASLQLKEYPQLQALHILNNNSLTSFELKEYPKLQILNISYNKQLAQLFIPNLSQILVFTLSNNSHLSKLKLGGLPQLLKLNMKELPELKVEEIDWQLNNELNFLGDDKIWESMKLKQPNNKAKRLKQWNRQWDNLMQLQKQGPKNNRGQYFDNILQIMK